MENNTNLTIALLIDTENVSPAYFKSLNDNLITLGRVTYKRMYGDFTSKFEANWIKLVNEYSITPIQEFSYTKKKNVSDSRLIIDAMDILYSNNVNAFCIMSSDSDFTGLVKRLKESGMYVIGAGEVKTPESFINACDRFFILNTPVEKKRKTVVLEKIESSDASIEYWSKDEVLDFTTKVLEESGLDQYPLASLMAKIYQAHPQFDVTRYGVRKAKDIFPKDRFSIEKGSGTEVYISLK